MSNVYDRYEEILRAEFSRAVLYDLNTDLTKGFVSEVDILNNYSRGLSVVHKLEEIDKLVVNGFFVEVDPEEYPNGTLIRRWGRP